ncbi:Dihydroflavonol-4-reductase [hydrothermal vent metagenome]|uniref:Dihydroflavonol-4-reductase n=1 Tax=hydrothermal vent metagenome TaxID=652676 RepID=A0A3B0V2N2_9ZZZZ
MSKINLVTGANGHLGNNLVRALLERGETVRASVRNPNNREPFVGLNCEVVQADLLDKPSLLRAMAGVDTLYQVAAVFKHWARDPQKEIIEPNFQGTRNVLEAAAEQGVRRVVYVSSEGAMDGHISPVDETFWKTNYHGNPYFRSKTETERLALKLGSELGLDLLTVLPSAIVGPNIIQLTPTMDVLRQALNNDVFVDVNFSFNFVDARDVAAGMIAAAENGRSAERYLLATEQPVNIRRILELAQELKSDVKIPPRAPKWVLLLIASGMELAAKLTGKPPQLLRSQVALFYDNPRIMNISKARTELGYDPRDGETAVRQALTYLREAH